jgi:hypothetical protein
MRRKIPVLLLAVALVLFVGLLFAVDRAVKASKRVRRRREANRRLIAAAAVAEDKNRQRTATAEASKALTSLIPAIHDHEIRHVE